MIFQVISLMYKITFKSKEDSKQYCYKEDKQQRSNNKPKLKKGGRLNG